MSAQTTSIQASVEVATPNVTGAQDNHMTAHRLWVRLHCSLWTLKPYHHHYLKHILRTYGVRHAAELTRDQLESILSQLEVQTTAGPD